MVVVGYGTNDKKIDFWIVKNSWGNQTGVNGYLYMERGYNICGIAKYAVTVY